MVFQAVLALFGTERQQFQQPVAHPLGILEVARNMGVRRGQLRQHLAQCRHQIRVLRRHRQRRALWQPVHLSHHQPVGLAMARRYAKYPLPQTQQSQQTV